MRYACGNQCTPINHLIILLFIDSIRMMCETKKKFLLGKRSEKKLCNFIKNRLGHSNGKTCLSALSLNAWKSSINLTFSRSQIVAGISVFFICTSVISFCLKTLPGMRVEIPFRPYIVNHTAGMNSSDFYQASTTEANFMLTTTQRPSGLFNRYSVNIFDVLSNFNASFPVSLSLVTYYQRCVTSVKWKFKAIFAR